MKICKSVLLAVFALMFMIAATAAAAPTLTFKFKTIRVPGALTTTVGGINNAGAMVGNYLVKGGGNPHGFLVMDGKWTHIDHPKSPSTVCKNINSSGAIVGNYQKISTLLRPSRPALITTDISCFIGRTRSKIASRLFGMAKPTKPLTFPARRTRSPWTSIMQTTLSFNGSIRCPIRMARCCIAASTIRRIIPTAGEHMAWESTTKTRWSDFMCPTITTRVVLSRRTDSAVPHKSKASPLMAMRLF